MGYELHITRKEVWSDESGPSIAKAEWDAVVETDPELEHDLETQHVTTAGEHLYVRWRGKAGALGYFEGTISSKYPEPELIEKMVEIAAKLNATVQGDDGETYPLKPAAVGAGLKVGLRKLRNFLSEAFSRASPSVSEADIPYRVGQRYCYLFNGGECTVTSIKPRAMHGMGTLTIRFDNGHELTFTLSGNLSVFLRPL